MGDGARGGRRMAQVQPADGGNYVDQRRPCEGEESENENRQSTDRREIDRTNDRDKNQQNDSVGSRPHHVDTRNETRKDDKTIRENHNKHDR